MHSRAVPEVSPTVLDALRVSPVGPALDLPLSQAPASNPIDDLLRLIPVPALPDIDRLLRPLSDLGSMFGTGIVEALDPADILQQSSRLLDTATTLGRSALDALPDSWAGESAEAAAEHGRRARAAAGELSERGDLIGEITRAATATVEHGNIELTAIAHSFATFAAATAPLAMTPPGQAALVAAAVEHVQAGLAVVARTRGELAGHTTAMSALTAPIPVPAPIAGAGTALPDPSAVTGATSDVASTIASITGSQGAAPTVPTAHTAGSAASVPAATVPAALASAAHATGASSGGNSTGGGVFGGGVAGGAVGVGAAGAPAAASGAPAATSAAPAAGGSRGPMLGGGCPGGAARGDDERRNPAGFLVSPTNTTDVVGDLPMVTPAVIGGRDDDW